MSQLRGSIRAGVAAAFELDHTFLNDLQLLGQFVAGFEQGFLSFLIVEMGDDRVEGHHLQCNGLAVGFDLFAGFVAVHWGDSNMWPGRRKDRTRRRW